MNDEERLIAAIEGAANELHTANLLAIEHSLWLARKEGNLGEEGNRMWHEVGRRIRDRLDL